MLLCAWGVDGVYSCQEPVKRCISVIIHALACLSTPSVEVIDPVGADEVFIVGILYNLNTSPYSDHAKAALVGCQLAGQKIVQVGFGRLGCKWRKGVASLTTGSI
jgi:sugar/nucleoside kinase (ribokinase family)